MQFFPSIVRAPLVSVAAFVGLVGLASTAAAKERAAEGWYTAPDGCPSGVRFAALVARRGSDPGPDAGRASAASASFVVTIRRTNRGFTGWVQPRQENKPGERQNDEPVDARVLRSESCAELADALALVVALGLHAPPAVDADSTADVSGSDASGTITRAQPASAPPAEPTLEATSAATLLELVPPRPLHQGDWALGGAAELTAVFGAAMPGVAVFAEHRAPGGALGWPHLQLDVRLGAAVATNSLGGGDVKARFLLTTVTLDLCPIGGSLAGDIVLQICGVGRAGRIRGTGGAAVERPRTAALPWAAAGVDARLLLAIGPRAFVGLRLGVLASLLRPAFVFDMPRETVAEVAPLVWGAGVDVGFAIP